MEQQAKKQIAQSIQDFQLPLYTEIPNVGLFLEQTTKFVSEYFATMPGITITSSMISNYVKKKLIPNPIKKQYSRESIAYLLFIAVAKNVVSLDDIQVLLTLQKKNFRVEEAYEYFRTEFSSVLKYVFSLGERPSTINETGSMEKELLRNILVTVSHRIYLELAFNLLRRG